MMVTSTYYLVLSYCLYLKKREEEFLYAQKTMKYFCNSYQCFTVHHIHKRRPVQSESTCTSACFLLFISIYFLFFFFFACSCRPIRQLIIYCIVQCEIVIVQINFFFFILCVCLFFFCFSISLDTIIDVCRNYLYVELEHCR